MTSQLPSLQGFFCCWQLRKRHRKPGSCDVIKVLLISWRLYLLQSSLLYQVWQVLSDSKNCLFLLVFLCKSQMCQKRYMAKWWWYSKNGFYIAKIEAERPELKIPLSSFRCPPSISPIPLSLGRTWKARCGTSNSIGFSFNRKWVGGRLWS